MWIVSICLILIAGVLLVASLSRNKNKDTSQPRPRKQAAGGARSAHSAPAYLSSTGAKLEDQGAPLAESETTSQAEEAQNRIDDGIKTLFSYKPVEVDLTAVRLLPRDVEPDIAETVADRIKQLKEFKSTLGIYKALDDPNVNLADLSKSIVLDPILSGRILKVANSAYFGMQKRVNSIGHALMVIGIVNLKHLLYQDGLRKILEANGVTETAAQNQLWEHSTLASICALHIHGLYSGIDRGTIFTLGLLHDVGKYVMLGLTPLDYGRARSLRENFGKISLKDEFTYYGINHSLIGQMVFQEWGFSDMMVKLCGLHHVPSCIKMNALRLSGTQLQYLVVLYIADQLAKVLAGSDGAGVVTPLEPSYYPLAQKERLFRVMRDDSLNAKIRKAKAVLTS